MSYCDKVKWNLSALHPLFLKHNEPQVRTLQTPQLISCKRLQRSFWMIYIFFIQSAVSARWFCRFSRALIAPCFLHIYNHFLFPREMLRVGFFFFYLQQIDECTNNPQLFLPVLYPPGIKQTIVTVLFTLVLVYISSISEKYQGSAVHTPCVFPTSLHSLHGTVYDSTITYFPWP